jgi:orotate phosphoribosyltransferase
MNDTINIFKKSGALLEGHYLLSSGLHSETYFQCALVLQYPELCKQFADKICNYFLQEKIDLVISPAVGGMVIGQEVGRQLNVRTIFAEREKGEMQIRRGFSICKDENVLVCEDVVTTGNSVKEVIQLIRKAGANLIGVAYIVDRSNNKVQFETKQFSIVQLDVKTYDPNACPLCKKNLPYSRPGSKKLK